MSEDKTYLFEVDAVNPEELYRKHMLRLAEEIGVVIDPETYVMYDKNPYHNNLSDEDYWHLTGKWIIKRTQNTLLDFMRSNFTEINYVRL